MSIYYTNKNTLTCYPKPATLFSLIKTSGGIGPLKLEQPRKAKADRKGAKSYGGLITNDK